MSAQEKARAQREEAEREVKSEEKQRIGGVVPNFNVVLGGQAVALTPKQKLSLAFHTVIDPYTVALAVLGGATVKSLTTIPVTATARWLLQTVWRRVRR